MTQTDLSDIATLDIAASRGPEGWICGLTMPDVGGAWLVEAGWHVRSDLRRQGYATEAALAVRDAARVADIEHLIAIIRPHNVPTQRVAKKVGLVLEREIDKFGGPALVFGADLRP